MHLVDDKHAVASLRRGHGHLLDEGADVVDTVVACRVELDDIEAAVFVELPTRITLVARFAGGGAVGAVDSFGKNTRTRRLAYPARTAEEIGMSQSAACDGIFERPGQCLLAYYAVECRRAVFSCRYDILFHVECKDNKKLPIIIIG